MTKSSKYLTEEFKREAVRLLENSGKSVPKLAKELGISDKSLYRWRNQYGTVSKESAKTTGHQVLEAELKALRQENKELRQQREILKKALSILSQNP